jgi:hypothetical protein
MRTVQIASLNKEKNTVEMVSIESAECFRFQQHVYHIHKSFDLDKREFLPGWSMTEESTGFSCIGRSVRTKALAVEKFFDRVQQAKAKGVRLSVLIKQASRRLKEEYGL